MTEKLFIHEVLMTHEKKMSKIFMSFLLGACVMDIYTDSYHGIGRTVEDYDFIEEFVNGLNLTDDLNRQAILIHLNYCPNLNLCRVSTETLKQRFKDIMQTSCCAPCSCEDDCVDRGNCCPDMYQNLTLNLEKYRYGKKYECISTWYIISAWTIEKDDSVWAIAKCSNRTETVVAQNCENMTMDVFNYETHVPVTDITTGTNYRIIHCAMCNGVHEDNIQGWSVQLNCTEMSMDSISLPNFENLNRGCILEYKSKNILNQAAKCYTVRTFSWLENTATTSLEKLCRLFQITYMYDYQYRNVFCMLLMKTTDKRKCHFNHIDPTVSKMLSTSYSFLIDYRSLVMWKQDDENMTSLLQVTNKGRENCSSNELYERHKNLCLPISCGVKKRFQNGSCASIYIYDPPKAYRVIFRLTSKVSFHKHYLYSGFATDVKDSLMGHLYASFKDKTFHLCKTNYFASDSREKIAYFIVEAYLHAPTMHKDPFHYLTELGPLSVNSSYYRNFQFQISLEHDKAIDCSTDKAVYCRSNDKYDRNFLKIFTWISANSPCPYLHLYSLIKLGNMSVCPKACTLDFHFLYPDDDEFEKTMCLSSSNICFKFGEYQLVDSYVCFCIETYFSKLKSSESQFQLSSNYYSNGLYIIHASVSLCVTVVHLGFVNCVNESNIITGHMTHV